MADQFSRLNNTGVSRPLQDIYNFYETGKYFPEPSFRNEKEKDNYLEMLARLLSQDEYSKVISGFANPDIPGGSKKELEDLEEARKAYALQVPNDAVYGAYLSRAQNKVPSYVNTGSMNFKDYIHR